MEKMTVPQPSIKKESDSIKITRMIVQCADCSQWRKIQTQQEYEEIRSKLRKEPFVCTKRSATTCCDDPPEIEKDKSIIWLMDKADVPQTPHGFKRRLVVRKDLYKVDCYYDAPNGKSLRSKKELLSFLDNNSQYKVAASPEDFHFCCPKIVDDTILSL